MFSFRDPLDQNNQHELIFQADWVARRQALPGFCDDPFGLGRSCGKIPDYMTGELFALSINSQWALEGHRVLVNASGSCFHTDRFDSSDEARFPSIFSSDRDTSISWSPGGCGFLRDPNKHSRSVEMDGARVGLAVAAEPSNWGSFLTRVLPKALMMRSLGLDRILVWTGHKTQREAILEVGWSGEDVISFDVGARYTFAHAVWMSDPTSQLYLSPVARNLLSGFADRFPVGSYERVFVARNSLGATSRRRCKNEGEIQERLSERGFYTVYPERLSFADQVSIFRGAKVVVGCSGAGMFNAVFCRPGTRLLEIESQRDWYWGHMNLFSSLGLDFGFQWALPDGSSGPPPHQAFDVDVKALLRRLDSWV